MRQVTIKEFQRNIYKHLSNLPFEITRFGKVIAQVISPGESAKEEPVEKPVLKKNCQYNKLKADTVCSNQAEGKYKVSYFGGEEPLKWEVYLCRKHRDGLKGKEDVEVEDGME